MVYRAVGINIWLVQWWEVISDLSQRYVTEFCTNREERGHKYQSVIKHATERQALSECGEEFW